MQLPLLSIAFAGALVMTAIGQDRPQNAAPTGKPRQEIQVDAPRAPRTTEVTTNALSKPQPPNQPTKPKRTYGGVVQDVRKSTNRWKMFSLRRPANLKEDDANVTREALRTEASGAVKLISVDF
jgi:hypothetical protein